MSRAFWILVAGVAVVGAMVGIGFVGRGEVIRGWFDFWLGVVLFVFALSQMEPGHGG